MKLSPEERSKVNSRNGRLGGPKTPEGRERSSKNALKHGLTARRHTLPGESIEDYLELTNHYELHYRRLKHPAKPQLIWTAVDATMQAQRAAIAHDCLLGDQVNECVEGHIAEGQRRVDYELDRLSDHPAAAIEQLKKFQPGCQEMARRFRRLDETLQSLGYLPDKAFAEALNLLGAKPDEDLARNPAASRLALYNGRLKDRDKPTPKQLPAPAQATPGPRRLEDVSVGRPVFVPDLAVCQDWISTLFRTEIKSVLEKAEVIRTGIDREHLRLVQDGAMMLPDGELPRLYLRYSVASDNRLIRAVKTLDDLLEEQRKRRRMKDRKACREKPSCRDQEVRRKPAGPPSASSGGQVGAPAPAASSEGSKNTPPNNETNQTPAQEVRPEVGSGVA